MALIYKITNDINGKIYIGKTNFSIEKRFKEHCRDAQKGKCKNRPLYSAINKYGIEHFHIESIEEVSRERASEREQYWINFYNSYHFGYNATLGGDGSYRINQQLIFDLFEEGKSLKEIKQKTSYAPATIRACLLEKYSKEKISKEFEDRKQRPKSIKVAQIDKNSKEIIKIFNSIGEANRETHANRHIIPVGKGKRKTAAGYIWRYLDEKGDIIEPAPSEQMN